MIKRLKIAHSGSKETISTPYLMLFLFPFHLLLLLLLFDRNLRFCTITHCLLSGSPGGNWMVPSSSVRLHPTTLIITFGTFSQC